MQQLLRKSGSAALSQAITLNPETPVKAIEPYLSMVDMVLVMSVHPGFGGQKFIPESIDKVKEVKKLLTDKGLENVDIEIDGGINIGNLASVLEAGVNVVVAVRQCLRMMRQKMSGSLRKLCHYIKELSYVRRVKTKSI